jgi:dTDP-4-dehydrorhamnose 3,5-epimerase
MSIDIQTPTCAPGIGSIILAPDSKQLIAGVRIEAASLWPDDRGYFMEAARLGTKLVADFASATTQVSVAVNYPGIIKAFHFHRHQTDVWVPAAGMFQVALVDLRPGSSTFGVKNTLYVGQLRPWQILIPPGVGHGYKIIGTQPSTLVYLTDRFYNPEDEGRIAYNDASISYDWELQHK